MLQWLRRIWSFVRGSRGSSGSVQPVGDRTLAAPLQRAIGEATAPGRVVRWRTRLASLAVAAGVGIFGVLGWLVNSGQATTPDLALTLGLQQTHNPLLVALMTVVSAFGFPPQSVLMVLAAMAFFWIAGYRRESGFVGLAAVGVSAVGVAAKLIWLRPRPDDDLVRVLGSAPGYSFPSGHTLLYVGFFGFLFYWSYAVLKKGRVRTALLWLSGLLIALVGPSRVYLGHHWSSDVLAAYALGLAYLLVLIRAYAAGRPAQGQLR